MLYSNSYFTLSRDFYGRPFTREHFLFLWDWGKMLKEGGRLRPRAEPSLVWHASLMHLLRLQSTSYRILFESLFNMKVFMTFYTFLRNPQERDTSCSQILIFPIFTNCNIQFGILALIHVFWILLLTSHFYISPSSLSWFLKFFLLKSFLACKNIVKFYDKFKYSWDIFNMQVQVFFCF